MLKENEARRYDTSIERINRQWSKKQVEREEFVKTNRLHYLRGSFLPPHNVSSLFSFVLAIRALLRKRGQVETKNVKSDIIRDYSKYESSAYGPLTRSGNFPDKLTDKFLVKSRFLDTYTGLLELESTLPNNALKIRLPAPKRINSTKDGYLKRQFRRERDLDNIYKDIVGQKEKKVEETKPLRFLIKVEKPVPRPPTPGVDVPSLVSAFTYVSSTSKFVRLSGRRGTRQEYHLPAEDSSWSCGSKHGQRISSTFEIDHTDLRSNLCRCTRTRKNVLN